MSFGQWINQHSPFTNAGRANYNRGIYALQQSGPVGQFAADLGKFDQFLFTGTTPRPTPPNAPDDGSFNLGPGWTFVKDTADAARGTFDFATWILKNWPIVAGGVGAALVLSR
jgi:hypothetical protein